MRGQNPIVTTYGPGIVLSGIITSLGSGSFHTLPALDPDCRELHLRPRDGYWRICGATGTNSDAMGYNIGAADESLVLYGVKTSSLRLMGFAGTGSVIQWLMVVDECGFRNILGS